MVHQVDALWQPELSVIPGNICNAYQGVPDISADRLGVACAVCGRSSDGAVIRCSSSHCSVAFHPMCARNAGQYLAVKEVGNKIVYKAFCGQHSQQARNRDRELGLAIEVYSCLSKFNCKVLLVFESLFFLELFLIFFNNTIFFVKRKTNFISIAV